MNRLKLPALCLTLAAFSATAEDADDLDARILEAQERIRQATAELAKLMSGADMQELKHLMGGEGGMEHIFAGLRRPRVGVVLSGDEDGVKITGVTPRSAAEEAGLERGDRIVSVGGAPVTAAGDDAVEEVRRAVTESTGDEPLTIGIVRGGERMEIDVTPRTRRVMAFTGLPEIELERFEFKDFSQMEEALERMREHGRIPRQFEMVMPGSAFAPVRLQLAEISPDLGEYFGTTEGVLVLKPDARHDLGLKAGDVILRLNDNGLRRPGDFYRELNPLEAGDILHMEIMRQGQIEILQFEVPEGHLSTRHPRVKVLRRGGSEL